MLLFLKNDIIFPKRSDSVTDSGSVSTKEAASILGLSTRKIVQQTDVYKAEKTPRFISVIKNLRLRRTVSEV